MTDAKALVTGASGHIGRHLAARLHEPRVLARDPAEATRQLGVKDVIAWSAEQAIPEGALDGVDVVFHLAASSTSSSQGRIECGDTPTSSSMRRVGPSFATAPNTRCRSVCSVSLRASYSSSGSSTRSSISVASPSRSFSARRAGRAPSCLHLPTMESLMTTANSFGNSAIWSPHSVSSCPPAITSRMHASRPREGPSPTTPVRSPTT
jgi:hypothetical protein